MIEVRDGRMCGLMCVFVCVNRGSWRGRLVAFV